MALTSKGHFIINGLYEFKAKSLKVNYESLAGPNSGRTSAGNMVIDWIYRRIRKLEIEMAPSTASDINTLLALVQGQEYTITYFDPLENAEKSIGVYTSNSSGDMYSGVIRNGLWQGVSFNAIEIEGET